MINYILICGPYNFHLLEKLLSKNLGFRRAESEDLDFVTSSWRHQNHVIDTKPGTKPGIIFPMKSWSGFGFATATTVVVIPSAAACIAVVVIAVDPFVTSSASVVVTACVALNYNDIMITSLLRHYYVIVMLLQLTQWWHLWLMCHLLLFGHDHVSRINRILISIFSFLFLFLEMLN